MVRTCFYFTDHLEDVILSHHLAKLVEYRTLNETVLRSSTERKGLC